MGPVDIERVINEGNEIGRKYTDSLFVGKAMLYHEEFIDDNEREDFYDDHLTEGTIWFERWPEIYPSADLFQYETIWEDVAQGNVGNCYFLASITALSKFDEVLEDIFITKEKNEAGIHGVQFYIRGKPWIVDVDDYLPFLGGGIYVTIPVFA